MKIKLDKERNIKFNMRSVMELERITKEPFMKTMSGFLLNQSATVETIVSILWAGLIHEDSELTIGGIYTLLDDRKPAIPFSKLIEYLAEPTTVFFDGGKEKNVKKPVRKIQKKK